MSEFLPRSLPAPIAALGEIVLDLRWTWHHGGDQLWRSIDPEGWERTRNPWTILQDVPSARLEALAADPSFVASLGRFASARRAYLEGPGLFRQNHGDVRFPGVAYFSMEFGLADALPLYAGGLGLLAGDFLKTASDLAVPMVGVGLLYQEGYFRQMIDAAGEQQETFPYNDPTSLPIRRVTGADGARLHVTLPLPGRTLSLRVWQAQVGRVPLYLLDSNDTLNSPVDRGITGKLYGGGSEMRLMQELVLGCAGWRLVRMLAPEIGLCHLNEGHAAFVVIERIRETMRSERCDFATALWTVRAGNVFTTHTPVAAGFDRFDRSLVRRYLAAAAAEGDPDLDALLALGQNHDSGAEPEFEMAALALRGSLATVGVSRLHGAVSREIFQPFFPRRPVHEVPIGYVTNGVHIPSWDSEASDGLWTEACGRDRWRGPRDCLRQQIEAISDETLWELREVQRAELIRRVRERLQRQLSSRGVAQPLVDATDQLLDPNSLTLGFARRFTAYKRPNLLLHDLDRLARLFTHTARPVQLVIAGKAHPDDREGKAMIRAWIETAFRPEFRFHVVFVEDYDISLAQELVQGVDVWINTPRRPWEACGTSGMKVLVNGGLNLSVRDGWWDEAYRPDVGWSVGNGTDDVADALSLYDVLENQVVPEFYDRDAAGIPRAWLARIRRSMATLTPAFSSNRMAADYVSEAYLPAEAELSRRRADGGAVARSFAEWEKRLRRDWHGIHLGAAALERTETGHRFTVPVYLGAIDAADIQVELYADPAEGSPAERIAMARGEAITGAANGFLYRAEIGAARPPDDYTARVLPWAEGARLPTELPLVAWAG